MRSYPVSRNSNVLMRLAGGELGVGQRAAAYVLSEPEPVGQAASRLETAGAAHPLR